METQETKKEKKPVYKKWWFWVIIIVVVFAIASQGGSSDNKDNSVQTSTNTAKSENTVKEIYGLNEEATLEGASITVTNVQTSKGSTYEKPKDGKEFVIVTIAIKNTGKSSISYNPYDYKMQNSQGQIESQTFYTGNSNNSLSYGELAPGGTVTGTIAFEQPTGDNGLILIYEGNFWTSSALKFKLY